MKNKKLKKFIKKNIGHIYTAIITAIITSSISVSAAVMISANNIAYEDNGNVSSVQEALDTLYNSVEVTTILPVGSIVPYMGTTAPTNYLICDGSEYNIEDYKKLADHFKKDFGSYNKFGGDGTTTFKIPDLRGEFLRGNNSGETVGTHTNEGLPNIIGSLGDVESLSASGAFTRDPGSVHVGVGSGSSVFGTISFSASNSNSIYGSSQHVTPTNTSVNYIIKVK